MLQKTETAEDRIPVVNDKFRISQRDQRQSLCACVSHIGGNAEKILEQKEQTECECRSLSLSEEVARQEKRDNQLEQRSAPSSEGCSKPAEQCMSSLVHNQVDRPDEERPSVSR